MSCRRLHHGLTTRHRPPPPRLHLVTSPLAKGNTRANPAARPQSPLSVHLISFDPSGNLAHLFCLLTFSHQQEPHRLAARLHLRAGLLLSRLPKGLPRHVRRRHWPTVRRRSIWWRRGDDEQWRAAAAGPGFSLSLRRSSRGAMPCWHAARARSEHWWSRLEHHASPRHGSGGDSLPPLRLFFSPCDLSSPASDFTSALLLLLGTQADE